MQKQKVVNPFDVALLDQLHGPVFMSPGVFTTQSTPSTDEKVRFYGYFTYGKCHIFIYYRVLN